MQQTRNSTEASFWLPWSGEHNERVPTQNLKRESPSPFCVRRRAWSQYGVRSPLMTLINAYRRVLLLPCALQFVLVVGAKIGSSGTGTSVPTCDRMTNRRSSRASRVPATCHSRAFLRSECTPVSCFRACAAASSRLGNLPGASDLYYLPEGALEALSSMDSTPKQLDRRRSRLGRARPFGSTQDRSDRGPWAGWSQADAADIWNCVQFPRWGTQVLNGAQSRNCSRAPQSNLI